MKSTDKLILPHDLVIAPASSFAPEMIVKLKTEPTDRIVTRPRSRARSLVVDAITAAFLEQFRSPATVIDAVMRHAVESGDDPTQLLEAIVPLLLRLRQEQLILIEGEASAAAIHPTFEPGTSIAGIEVMRCVHLFDDVEVYRTRSLTGEEAALKILRAPSSLRVRHMLDREAAILSLLCGAGAPSLLASGEAEGRPYLLQSWCEGIDALHAAASFRFVVGGPYSEALLAICANVLRAYVDLHARGVVHGDVHPANIRIGKDGTVTLLDFGIARCDAVTGNLPPPGRGGLHEYLEPEYCAAGLVGKTPPLATPQSDQYALAALLYRMLTGTPRQEFSLDRDVWLRQVAEGEPLPFAARQCPPWPEMESVLACALSTDPSSRFSSTGDLLDAFERVNSRRQIWSPTVHRSVAFLAAVLDRLAPEEPPVEDHLINRLPAPRCSINYGAAGIVWFLYRTAGMRDDAKLLAAADIWCARALQLVGDEASFASSEIGITRDLTGGISPFHSLSGVHLVHAHVNAAMGDIDSARRSARAFIEASAEPCDNPDLTLGWASVLLGCSSLMECLRHFGPVVNDPVFAFGKQFAEWIERWMANRRIGDAHDMRWLGLAHGWAGLLLALLRWTQASETPLSSIAWDRLHQLATLGVREGKATWWPLRLGDDASDRVPFTGWCHGSAGYVLLWTLAHQVLKDNSFLVLARGSASHLAESFASERCLESSLCCGFAGQGFALMSIHRATNDPEFLRLAREACERAVTRASRTTRPDSLYKGDVGIAALIQELTQPSRSCMPLVEAEGW